MSNAPAMPLFLDAYLADTTHLNTEEHGAYLLLLMAMWRRNGSVPNDDKDLARIVGLTTRKWLQIKARLLPFLDVSDGELSQKRLQKEWDFVQEKRKKNAQNGSLGGRPKSNENNEIAKANGSVQKTERQSTHTHTHIKEKKHTVHSHPESDFFEAFWRAYPKREGPNPKKPARERFIQLVRRGVDPEIMIGAARELAGQHPTPTRFVPQAMTFLRQERWDEGVPQITGDEFCPEEWPNTRFLVIRFRDHHGGDPPRAIHGGKLGYMLPAEWVQASRDSPRQQNG